MLAKDKEDKLIEIFVTVDDFCQMLNDYLEQHPDLAFKRERFEGRMTVSEILSVIIFYQFSGYKCFKYYYENHVQIILQPYFPEVVSYKRFLRLILKSVPHLYVLAKWRSMQSEHTGIYYVDSTKLAVCHNKRIYKNKVFKDLAQRGRTSTGWFFGLKAHLVINNIGQIMNFTFTPGNVSDNNPDVLRTIFCKLKGKAFGDKGYLSKIFGELYEQGLKLITKLRKNMKNKLLPIEEKYQLFKRGIVETVYDILKSVFDLEHSRHRSPQNAMAHMLAALVAYSFLEQKPTVFVPQMLN